MTRVCVAGVTGWTGRPVAAAIAEADDLELVSGVSRSAAEQELGAIVEGAASGRVYASVAEALAATQADVLVDYTEPGAVKGNVLEALERGVAVIVGTSGLDAEDFAEIDARARAKQAGVIAAGNFSLLAALLLRFAGEAARHVDAWEIVDYASAGKPDVPSGTARELAERLGEVREPAVGTALADLHGPVEARGASIGGTQVHSVRLPGFVLSTETVFGATGERLVLRHEAGESAAPYVAGTLLAIRAVHGRVGVTRGLDRLIEHVG